MMDFPFLNQEMFEPTLKDLMERGWISAYAFHEGGRYSVKWTRKGRTRARWINALRTELNFASQSVLLVSSICEAHGD